MDNRPGAGGLIGGTAVARSNPDGYTIALIGQPHLTATLLSKDPPWDPFKDFAHIGMVATMPNVVTVGPGLPVKTALRADRAGQGETRALQLRLGRRRQLLAPRRRDVQRGGRAQGRARPLQAARRHLAEMLRRPGPLLSLPGARRDARLEGREVESAGRRAAAPGCRPARRAHPDRIRAAGLHLGNLFRSRWARRRCRKTSIAQHQRRRREAPQDRRREEPLPAAGRGSDAEHARRSS